MRATQPLLCPGGPPAAVPEDRLRRIPACEPFLSCSNLRRGPRRYRLRGSGGGLAAPRRRRAAQIPRLRRLYLGLALDHRQNFIDQAVFLGLVGGEELI